MTFDEKVSEKISKETAPKITRKIKERDALVQAFAAEYPILLLGDREAYPLLNETKEKMSEEGLSAMKLEDINSESLSDAAKMDCINEFEGTIIMLSGQNPGTVTETTIIRKNKALRNKTHLFFEGGIPDYAKNTSDYPMYFPRKTVFKNEDEFKEAAGWISKQDAFVHGNDKAMEKLCDKNLNTENEVINR